MYHRKAVEEGFFEKETSGENREVFLSSLKVFTDYFIAVQAFTSAGGGEWSETRKVKTLPGSKDGVIH